MKHSFQYHTGNTYTQIIMINERKVRSYCFEDISLIENYDKAVADKTQTWQCHHRAEILPCGRFSRSDLVQHGLLFNRPANELVFLTQFEHKSIHKNHLGKTQDRKTREKISLGKKGTVWANNGIMSKMFNPDSVPTGWSLGRISWKVSE